MLQKKQVMKQVGATKLMSVGGNKSPNAVAKVYSSIEEPQINYPDVPLGNIDEEHSFVRKIDDKIFVAWPNRNARHGNTH